ncbi:aminoglycoside phosphotransferase (APT) family kinase protein [Streptomyces griseochromogenes]|uniref:Aminoglycoside phosphotransferase (APT) family kinase protein n=2 Tax=Streptomyces griseochromogenes TaxID=68214 RepID=A0ABS4LVI1_9ACTN|nr:aminoglycoside phosphotransferase family protein [Streptomyces griseochromogenes]MBP2051435.1 aminoglycoside phosphotransferase (APT) family kinase protein [Streptomyces griseochromogenes]
MGREIVMDAMALYEEARAHENALSGFYHRNVRVEDDSGPLLVRIPGPGAEPMDLTLWPEPEVLRAIRPFVSRAPRLVHAGVSPDFQIHEFIAGRRVDEIAQDGKPLPDVVLDGVEQFFGEVLRVPTAALAAVPPGWPDDGDTPGFARCLLDFARHLRDRADASVDALYQALGVPADPCGPLLERAGRELARRPFRLLHGDIHRKNMILSGRAGLVVLDWELALWGDPLYDLADHLHKTAYTAADRQRTVAGWERAAPADCRAGAPAGLGFYLAYEEMKSALVDTVRWGRRIVEAPAGRERQALAAELRTKLLAARPHWDAGPLPEAAEIEDTTLRLLG